MTLDTKNKKCDDCGLFLEVCNFYKNKVKKDGLQNRCKDCMKDYKLGKRNFKREKPTKDFYYIPDIFLVGYGRTQCYQHCCLSCEAPFFCLNQVREEVDLFCPDCEDKDLQVFERSTSPVNYIGNVVGWIAKTESPDKKRSYRNYKKVFTRDEFTCQYCGYCHAFAKEFMELHIDHIKPWSAMGGNSLSNLVVACRECNLLASDKWFTSFEEKKDYILFEKQKKLFKLSDVNK